MCQRNILVETLFLQQKFGSQLNLSMCALNIKSVKDQFMYIELNTDS